ncbi:MAG: UDP-forming cellulose synthase catalytic subunit [Elusimicrobia bacterium]|nr:UDP-forming cellulose synthase catalytic subunit [Elusimicrobiota bacterium]
MGLRETDEALRRRLVDALPYLGLSAVLLLFLHLQRVHLTLADQFVVGWALVAVLFVLKRFDRVRKPPLRIIFILLSVFLSTRYVLWRTRETLVYTGPADCLGMLALYAAEMYAIALHLLGVFTSIWPLEHKVMPLPEDPDLWPSVDILIPTYNEPKDIVRVTATAALHIDYPREKLNVWILDDGGTVAKRAGSGASAWERHYDFRRLAADLGVGYITREKNLRAKAGNLNHALSHTSGDLVLILDCDHVPARDILKNTVGWFLKDRKVAFVQTPHFFINPNPIEKNLAIFRDAPSENDMFYRGIHPGLDLWNSSYFCGSAAILRRTALAEVGGICGETITEDCETALALHRRGYKSVYIPRPMVCGLSPETFDDLIVQKQRWAQGMVQILILNNPLFGKGLKLYQRICYFNSCLYWFFGVSRVVFYVAPAAFLLFSLKVYFASVPQVLAFALPHVIGSIVLTGFLYGRYRWPFFSEFFEGIQSLFLLPVMFSVLANPRKPSFKVTPKGKNLEGEVLSSFAWPFLILVTILLFAVPAAAYRWVQLPMFRDITAITFVWCVFNLILGLASFGAFLETKQVRRYHRMWADGKIQLYLPRLNLRLEADVHDVSLCGIGLSFKLKEKLAALEHVMLESRNSFGRKFELEGRVSRHAQRGSRLFCGVELLFADKEKFAQTVEFVYGDSQRWADFWQRKTRPASLRWIFRFVVRSASAGIRVYLMAVRQFVFAPALERLRAAFERLRARSRRGVASAGA